jgi:hypothetical protein
MADESTPESTPEGTTEQEPVVEEQPETDQLGDGGKKALEAERSRAKEAERRVKAMERELQQLKTASLSDQERAVAEAKLAGRQEAAAEAGKRLAHAELRAAAAAKGVDASKQLDYLDLSRFVGDDGEPDPAAIGDWVKTLTPPSSRPRGDIDQGNRGAAVAKPAREQFGDFLQAQIRSQ